MARTINTPIKFDIHGTGGDATAAAASAMTRMPHHHSQIYHASDSDELLDNLSRRDNDSTTTTNVGNGYLFGRGAVFIDGKENNRHADNNPTSSKSGATIDNSHHQISSSSSLASANQQNQQQTTSLPDHHASASEDASSTSDAFGQPSNLFHSRYYSKNNDTDNAYSNTNNNHEYGHLEREEEGDEHYHDGFDDDEDDDDDCSEASGDTVVHNDCPMPPPNATQEEITRFYWEWCYGPIIDTNTTCGMAAADKIGSGGGQIRSMMRSAPAKSCLSTRKKQVNDVNKPNLADSMTPRRLLHHTSPSYSNLENHGDGGDCNDPSSSALHRQPQHQTTGGDYALSTPTDENDVSNNNNNNNNCGLRHLPIHPTTATTNSKPKPHHTSAIKFGVNTAAEFHMSQPTTEMTPIPLSEVEQILPLNDNEDDATKEEHVHSRETAKNMAMLAEWDDDFDSFVEDSDDDDDDDNNNDIEDVMMNTGEASSAYRSRTSDLPGGRTMKRGRKRTPYKTKKVKSHRESSGGGIGGGGRRRSVSSSGASSRRRESSLFSRERRSLIDLDDSMDIMTEEDGRRMDDENNTLLPYSVYIDPTEYTSPSSTSISDSLSTLSTPGVVSTTTKNADVLVTKTDNDNITKGMAASTASSREESQRRSLDSACVSPSSLKSSLTGDSNSILSTASGPHRMNPIGSGSRPNGNVRRSNDLFGRQSSDSNSSTNTGKETPNSARTSSSTILRAVHASGALLPGNSPRGDSGHSARRGDDCKGTEDNLSFSMEEVKHSDEGGSGRLRPNQLKYSPSSSSSCGSRSLGDGRMLPSPSDSASVNSDMMSLFRQYNLGGTFDHSRSNDHFFLLSEQLSILSAHPTHPFHTSISDLMQWSRSSTHDDKELLEFMNGVLLRGITPSASLALIVDDLASTSGDIIHSDESKTLFDGKIRLLPSTVNIDHQNVTNTSSIVQRGYESLLLDEITNMCSSNSSSSMSCQDWGCADSHTISSCIQHIYQLSCMDWLSLEVDAAERTLVRLQNWTESIQQESWISTTCCKKLKMSHSTMSKSSQASLKLHRHRVQTQMNDETSQIATLEEQLSTEVNLLEETKCIKRYLDAQLSVERCSPISLLNEEIRALILPSLIMSNNGTSFSVSLLEGAAEIVLKIALDGDDYDDIEGATITASGGDRNEPMGIEMGCFIKDGDDASIKLLWALLLGEIPWNSERNDNDPIYGPHKLRENLSSFIIESRNNSRVDMLHQLTHTASRIDSLVRSVRDLETDEDCVCHVAIASHNSNDVSLLISMPSAVVGSDEGELRLNFTFINLLDKDCHVVTSSLFVPNDVKITIVSAASDAMNDPDNKTTMDSLQRQMQEKGKSMILGGCKDPILLKRICGEVKRMGSR